VPNCFQSLTSNAVLKDAAHTGSGTNGLKTTSFTAVQNPAENLSSGVQVAQKTSRRFRDAVNQTGAVVEAVRLDLTGSGNKKVSSHTTELQQAEGDYRDIVRKCEND